MEQNLLTEDQYRLLQALVENTYDNILKLHLQHTFGHAIMGGLLAACAQYWELPETQDAVDELSTIAVRITAQYILDRQTTRRRLQA